MKKVIIVIFIVCFLVSCTKKGYYNELLSEEVMAISYYCMVTTNYKDTLQEYVIPGEKTYSMIDQKKYYNNSLINKMMKKNDGKVVLDTNFVILDEIKFDVVKRNEFLDSIMKVSTKNILKNYFIDKFVLNDSLLNYEQRKSVIYTLLTRRKYLYSINNNEKHYSLSPVYYGKIKGLNFINM